MLAFCSYGTVEELLTLEYLLFIYIYIYVLHFVLEPSTRLSVWGNFGPDTLCCMYCQFQPYIYSLGVC